MPNLDDLTPEQIDALFTEADMVAEAHVRVDLCRMQGQMTLARQDMLALQAALGWFTTVPTEERLDPGEA